MLYLDWNATTPPAEEVVEAMTDAARRQWGNPSSLHRRGRDAKAIVERAREGLGHLLVCHPRDVFFTSGGTEANNLGVLRPFLGPCGEVVPGLCVTSRLEHPSVAGVAELLASRGVTVVWLPVPSNGQLDPQELRQCLRQSGPGPRLVTVQSVNHETGVRQPVADFLAEARAAGAEVHVDAVQAIGKLPSDAWAGGDSVAVAAHKIRGPKGVGALGGRAGLLIRPLFRGGGQERGLRPGTLDPVAVAGFEAAVRRAETSVPQYAAVAATRDLLEARLLDLAEHLGLRAVVNGRAADRAPHVSNISWEGWEGDELAAALDLEGLCVSAGSACAAGTPEPSPVLSAMVGRAGARGAVRLSLGEVLDEGSCAAVAAAFARVLRRGSAG